MSTAMESRWVVYRLRCPITKEVKYIGITSNAKKRKHQHGNRYSSREMREWVRAVRQAGLRPVMEIISEPMPRPVARSWEVTLHFFFDRFYPGRLLCKETVRVKRSTIEVVSVYLSNPPGKCYA